MKTITTTLLILITLTSWSQTIEYFDHNWIPCERENAAYFRVNEIDEAAGLLYVKDHYLSGQVQMTGSYKMVNTEIKHGYFVWRYESGQISREVAYKNGVETGPSKSFFENGHTRAELYYDYKNIAWPHYKVITAYDSAYNQTIIKSNGTYFSYYDSGTLSDMGSIVEGLRTGKWTGQHKNGQKLYSETYKTGQLKKGVSWDLEGNSYSYKEIEEKPMPAGGYENFYKRVAQNLIYPESARQYNIEGKVFVRFTISSEGQIQDLEVVHGLGFGCDEAAIQAVRRLNKWKPGKFRGQNKEEDLILPLTFRLTG